MKTRTILIVGAGIGGLTLARLLVRDGHRVTLLERAKDFSAQGHSIGFRGVGLQVMQELGLRERIEKTGRHYRANYSRTLKGRPLRTTYYADHAEAVGGNTTTRRGLIHAALAENLPPEIDLQFGVQPVEIDDSGPGVSVKLSDGRTLTADLLVGADGANSAVRRLAMPEVGVLDFGGVYIGMTIKTDHRQPLTDVVSYWGRGRLVAFFPIDTETIAVVVYQDDTYGPTPADDSPESWAAYFKRSLKGAAEPVGRILSALKPGDDVFHDRIRQVPAVQVVKGRVVLVGDSGYCPTFFSGNGAALASVGAYCLAKCLAATEDDSDALAHYQARILPFAATYQAAARRMRRTLFTRGALFVALRQLGMKYMPAGVFARAQRRHYRGEVQLSDVV